jgi:hypothetical protein
MCYLYILVFFSRNGLFNSSLKSLNLCGNSIQEGGGMATERCSES